MSDKFNPLLAGGHWTEGTYAPTLKISTSYRDEIPNIIKLSTEFGQLKNMVEMELVNQTEEVIIITIKKMGFYGAWFTKTKKVLFSLILIFVTLVLTITYAIVVSV